MKKFMTNIVGNTLSVFGVTLTPQTLENIEHVLAIICLIVGLLITITSSVLIPLIKWWKKAKEDGKIDEEEAKEGKNIFKRFIDILKNFFHKKDKEE